MKSVTKLISALLCVFLLLSALSGCTARTVNETTTGTTATSAATSATTATPTPLPDGPSWSWDTSPWDLGTWYVGAVGFGKATNGWNPDTVMNDKVMFEKTGLQKVTFIAPATAENEKLNVLIASQELPDVITLDTTNSAANREKITMLREGGLLEPLLELADKYAPTFRADIPEAIINWYSAPDGKLYCLPSDHNSGRRKVENPVIESHHQTIVRKDIADQLGIKVEDFMTQEGFIAALRKFRDANLTQDGASILPIIMAPLDPYNPFLAESEYFGMKMEDEKGNYVPPIKSPKYKEFLQFMNRLFREGFITEQNLMMKLEEGAELVLNNRAFMIFGRQEYAKQYSAVAVNTEGKINFMPVETVRSKEGNAPEFSRSAGLAGWLTTYVSTTAKNKEKTIRFLEYLWSVEGNIQMALGTEGVTYVKRPDGYLEKTPEYVAEYAANRAATLKKYGLGSMYMVREPALIPSFDWFTHTPDAELKWDQKIQKASRILYSKYMYQDTILKPLSNIDPDPGSEEADIQTKIKIFMDAQIIKMIVAKTESEFEELFQEAVNYQEKNGLEKLVALQNQKFLALKKKMNVDFVYPSNKKK